MLSSNDDDDEFHYNSYSEPLSSLCASAPSKKLNLYLYWRQSTLNFLLYWLVLFFIMFVNTFFMYSKWNWVSALSCSESSRLPKIQPRLNCQTCHNARVELRLTLGVTTCQTHKWRQNRKQKSLETIIVIIKPILIQVYPRKRGVTGFTPAV